MIKRVTTAILSAGFALGASAAATESQMVKVITSGGFAQAYREVIPEFERSTGIKVETGSGASEGIGPKTIRHQLAHGTEADVVILSREGLEKLIEDGRIRRGSEVGLATAPLAAAVRAGSMKPDISTDASFKQALIDAGQVVMPGSTSGQFVRDKVFSKLKLPDTVTLNLVARGTESAALLSAGKANLAIGPASELVNLPGIEIIGLLPEDLQVIQTFTAAIVNDARNPEAAKRLTDFLSSDHVLAAIKRAGMEQPKGR